VFHSNGYPSGDTLNCAKTQFNVFVCPADTLDRSVEGTGLGLVITQRLLEMMHGTISVKSEYGKGSVFSVKIPQKILTDAKVGDFQARFETNVLEARAYRESFRAPDAHVLIVDDTSINLTVVVNLLKDTKMQIDTATSGKNAVAMAENTAYDVILMDQRMPETARRSNLPGRRCMKRNRRA